MAIHPVITPLILPTARTAVAMALEVDRHTVLQKEAEVAEVAHPTNCRLILLTMILLLQPTLCRALQTTMEEMVVSDQAPDQQLHQATLHLIRCPRCGMVVALAVAEQAQETAQQLARVRQAPLVPLAVF